MSLKQFGGVFGRNPTFNDVTIEGELTLNGNIFTGLDYQGTWNASTNTPTLTSSTGITGEFYIVSVAGATNLNGITNWGVGDWAMFNGTAWQRVEGGANGNFVDLSVTGNATLGSNVTISGGTINGTAIGGTTRAAGNFTTLDANGNVILGDATADTISTNGRFNTDLVPSTTNTRDLGTSALLWKQVYATTFTEAGFGVVSQTDIGTAANEIPLNQYLGTMAYLDADNIGYGNAGTNGVEQNLAINKASVVTISADTTLTTTVPKLGSTAFVIVITSGATSRTVTFGTGFKSTGTLATGTDADRRFVFQFISDGTNLLEVSRTAAITY
jgi:hypothetical protein